MGMFDVHRDGLGRPSGYVGLSGLRSFTDCILVSHEHGSDILMFGCESEAVPTLAS